MNNNNNNSTRQGKDAKSIDNLTVVASSLASANDALREVIQCRDDEIGRLEVFEEQFRSIRDEFSEFKELAGTHDKHATELEIRLKQEVDKYQRTCEDLKAQIVSLKRDIDAQGLENKKLEQELKDSVDRLPKLNYTNDYNENSYANAFPMSTANSFAVQRLCGDIK